MKQARKGEYEIPTKDVAFVGEVARFRGIDRNADPNSIKNARARAAFMGSVQGLLKLPPDFDGLPETDRTKLCRDIDRAIKSLTKAREKLG